jgi:hypothetical protein
VREDDYSLGIWWVLRGSLRLLRIDQNAMLQKAPFIFPVGRTYSSPLAHNIHSPCA